MVDDFSNVPRRMKLATKKDQDRWFQIMLSADKRVVQQGKTYEIVAMRDAGFSIRRISEETKMTPTAIKTVTQPFDKLTSSEKKDFKVYSRENSVFNFKDRAEEIFNSIQRMARVVEDNPELYISYLAEQRQMLKLAKELYESAMKQSQHQEEMAIFVDEIRKADDVNCPHCKLSFKAPIATNILKRLQMVRQSKGMFGS